MNGRGLVPLALALLAGCAPPMVCVYVLPPQGTHGSDAAGLPKHLDPLERSCSLGDARGCNSLGYLYDYGEGGVSEDRARAAELYRRACDGKNGAGCGNLANLYHSGRGAKAGVAKDPARAFEYASRGCELKHGQSCYNLGVDYQMGDGVGKDQARAVEFYTIACRENYPEACNNLGFMYFSGLGVGRDLDKAQDLYRQACTSAVGRGCSNWAHLVETAQTDLVRAAILYRLACMLGDAAGCIDVEWLPGLRSPSFATRARAVRAELDGGCDKGSAESCRLAGVLLQSGIGIAPEPLAAQGRFQDGCRLLDQVSCDALETSEGAPHASP
jgi:TPR repeat protein